MRSPVDEIVELAVSLGLGLGLITVVVIDLLWPLALRAARWILEMR